MTIKDLPAMRRQNVAVDRCPGLPQIVYPVVFGGDRPMLPAADGRDGEVSYSRLCSVGGGAGAPAGDARTGPRGGGLNGNTREKVVRIQSIGGARPGEDCRLTPHQGWVR